MSRANHRRSHVLAGFVGTLAAIGLLVLLGAARDCTAEAPQSVSPPRYGGSAQAAAARKRSFASGPRRTPVPWDDGTYRATVVVRRGTTQGSGTIIASVESETLVLTAAHVVKGDGPIAVELHRYNLGVERLPATAGGWPRVIKANLVVADTAADVSIVRIEKMTALPYVARFTHNNEEPPPNAIVASIGIDLGRKLTHWNSRLVETVTFELNDSGSARPFLITEKIPEHGRSGGGLFLTNGELVGVCVGHSELVKGKRMGVFAASESIRRLIDDQHLGDTLLRSELRMARLELERSPTARLSGPTRSTPVVTPTRSGGGEPPVTSTP